MLISTKSIKFKVMLSSILLCLIFTIILGTFSISEISRLGSKMVGEQALEVVKTVSYQIDGNKFEQLGESKDASNLYYKKMYKLMKRIKKRTGCKYLYSMKKITENKYMYVLTGDSDSPIGSTEDTSDYGPVFKGAMDKGTSGYTPISYDSKYGSLLSAVVPIRNSAGRLVGILACDVSANSIYARLKLVKYSIIAICTILTILILFSIYLFLKKFFKRIDIIVQATKTVSLGNLTSTITDYKKDEFGNISDNFNLMVLNANQIVKDIKNAAEAINQNASDLSAVSEEVSSSSHNSGEALDDITKDIALQSDALIEVSNSISQFSADLENMNDFIKSVEEKGERINDTAAYSNENLNKLHTSLNDVNNIFIKLKSKITSFDENISKINNISAEINEIADQTNLLSLNAAIESARAGEAGKGFGVVSDEIRKLSELTKSSSNDITNLATKLSSEGSTVNETIDYLNTNLADEMNISKVSLESFKGIIDDINEILPRIKDISNQADDLKNKKDEILDKIQSSSSAAQHVSASSEEISACFKEINSSSEEVAKDAQDLDTLTNVMIKKVNSFKV